MIDKKFGFPELFVSLLRKEQPESAQADARDEGTYLGSLIWAIDIVGNLAYNVGMNSRQYTIRSIPPSIDRELRNMSKKSGRSLNATAIEVMRVGLGIPYPSEPNHDLDDLFGALDKKGAKQLNNASKKLRTIDRKKW